MVRYNFFRFYETKTSKLHIQIFSCYSTAQAIVLTPTPIAMSTEETPVGTHDAG